MNVEKALIVLIKNKNTPLLISDGSQVRFNGTMLEVAPALQFIDEKPMTMECQKFLTAYSDLKFKRPPNKIAWSLTAYFTQPQPENNYVQCGGSAVGGWRVSAMNFR